MNLNEINHINNKRKFDTFTNMWRLNHSLLNKKWLKKTQGKLENTLSLKK